MSAQPFASVVVPTASRKGPLADCLESLLAQDYPKDRYEIVVVENGSSEAAARVGALAADSVLPHVRYLHQRCADANAARNAGVRASRGDPVCLVDDDVLAPPGWLSTLVAAASRHPGAGCIGGPIRPRFEREPPRTCGGCVLAGAVFDEGPVEAEVEEVWGGNMAVPRASFESVGPFLEGLPVHQEWQWQRRLRAAGGRIVYAPDAWLWHRHFDSDLRVGGLVREYFQRGYTRGRLSEPPPPRALAEAAVGFLGHALRARCTRGLTEAARHAGLLRAALARRRQPAQAARVARYSASKSAR
jgi:GT2 family glycosyltransferase